MLILSPKPCSLHSLPIFISSYTANCYFFSIILRISSFSFAGRSRRIILNPHHCFCVSDSFLSLLGISKSRMSLTLIARTYVTKHCCLYRFLNTLSIITLYPTRSRIPTFRLYFTLLIIFFLKLNISSTLINFISLGYV